MEILIPALKILLVLFITVLWFLAFNQIIRLLKVEMDPSFRDNPKVVLTGLFINICIILSILFVIIFIDKKDISVLGFALNQTGILFIAAIAALTVIIVLTFLWILHKTGSLVVTPAKFTFNRSLWVTILLLSVGALMEEILFRGYLTLNLMQYGILIAVLVSSLIFTIIHFMTGRIDLYHGIEWFIGGVALFLIYLISGSIWAAAAAHFIRNFSNVVFLNIAKTNSLFTFDKAVDAEYRMFYSVILYAVWVIAAYMIYHPVLK